MKLHFLSYPESVDLAQCSDATPLLIVPGLFGSTSNWRSFARRFAETRPAIVIDQRNHGQSPHASSQSYADMVQDLLEFCDQHALAKIDLCGHSMGGKVAMLFTLAHPQRVNKLAVLDIAPIDYQHNHAPFLKKLMQLDLHLLKSRNQADIALREAIPDTATRLFLLQSLRGSPGAYRWNLNLSVLHDYMAEITGFPQTDRIAFNKTLFVAGALSDYLLDQHHDKIRQLFPNASFATVAEAGHWLHAEQADRVLKMLINFIQYDK